VRGSAIAGRSTHGEASLTSYLVSLWPVEHDDVTFLADLCVADKSCRLRYAGLGLFLCRGDCRDFRFLFQSFLLYIDLCRLT
jgi:hypothetical protein